MSPDTSSLTLTGDLTVRRSAELHAALAQAVGRARHVALDCRGAERVDLSFLQLVLAAREAARAQQGDLILAPAAPAVSEAACRAGLAGPGAVADAADHAFWHASETGAP